jgi:nitronate monooxygenase
MHLVVQLDCRRGVANTIQWQGEKMDFLKNIKLIQGGMGVYVSNWRLAKAIAMAKPGVTAGTVSGTALDVVYVRLLQLGDPGGHIHRAFNAFDTQFGLEIGRKTYTKYFVAEGKPPGKPYKYGPGLIVHSENGDLSFTNRVENDQRNSVTLNEDLIELIILTAFAEIWLAKEGHIGNIFINFLKKIELPMIYGMYGAMLAGVDGIVVGAGNPQGLPAICSKLSRNEEVTSNISVLYRDQGDSYVIHFDPKEAFGGKLTQKPIGRPAFLAIVSLENLVTALVNDTNESPDGFIIEHHTAGGHNAMPLGPLKRDDLGQPVYSDLDEPDLVCIRQLGVPFWLAGGYGSKTGLEKAFMAGANGIQTGSIFALSIESGLTSSIRSSIFNELKKGTPDSDLILTSLYSPTGFPFKVLQLSGSLSDEKIYSARRRVCNLGFLRQLGLGKSDEGGTRQLFQRCPAGPIDDFINKRGLPLNSEGKRCLCNGLLAGVGLGQIGIRDGALTEEPAIITLGNDLQGIRRLSRQGQVEYSASDCVEDILET